MDLKEQLDRMGALLQFLGVSASDLHTLVNKAIISGEKPLRILIPHTTFNGLPLVFADVSNISIEAE